MARKGDVITQADVAKKAGVSPMTVSYALRGSPVVAEATRERVLAAAEELGYRPNPMVANLMQYVRAGKVSEAQARLGLVWAGFSRGEVRGQSSLHELEKGILEQTGRAGFHVDTFYLPEENLKGKRLSDILWSRGIVGVLLVAGRDAEGLLAGFDFSRFAVSTCSYALQEPALHRACAYHFDLIHKAVDHLRSQRLGRIGVVLPDYLDEPVHIHKAAVFALQQNEDGRDIRALFDYQGSATDLEAWLRRERPGVLLCGTLRCARGVRERLTKAGSSLPVASLEAFEGGGIPGMCQDNPALGAAMADLVVGQLSRNERGIPRRPKTVLIPGFWVEG